MVPPREETRGRSRGDRTGDGRGSASGVEVRRTVFGAGILALALVPERVAVLRRSHRALQHRAAVGVASARGHLP